MKNSIPRTITPTYIEGYYESWRGNHGDRVSEPLLIECKGEAHLTLTRGKNRGPQKPTNPNKE